MKAINYMLAACITMFSAQAFAGDPCSVLNLPSEIKNTKVLFIMPTYNEFVREIAENAINDGVILDENLVATEAQYTAYRNKKVKHINKNFQQDFKILSQEEYEKRKGELASSGFNYGVHESVDLKLLENTGKSNWFFYTNFSLRETTGRSEYAIVDLQAQDKVDCVYTTSKRSFINVLEVFN